MEDQENLSEQKRLHDQAVNKLSEVFAALLPELTPLTAVEVSTNFFASAMVYVFEQIGRLPNLSGKTVGAEVKRRIDYLKDKKNGSESEAQSR